MEKEIFKRILSSIILIPITIFFIFKGSFFFNFFIFICFLISIYEWQMMSKKKFYNILGHLFILFSYYSVFFIRNNLEENSLFIFLAILLICISTDVGGYIFGKFFKGPKLTKISPNKTYAGVFGSFFLSIVFINILAQYSFFLTDQHINFGIVEFIFVLIISLVSQIGDIIISYFKRISKIKDTGNLIPGHGGLLDRTDGMIFAFPFYYVFNSFINII